MTSQNSFFKWLALLWVYKTCIDRRCEGEKMEHYKCLTGLGMDAQNSGRTPGLLAFEGSLLRLFKQGDAQ